MSLSKQSAAMLSVLASIVLATIKVLVGVITGSLSILAESADSILDLLAAGISFLAVRVADVPPDDNHPYGHARAENLGALAQTVLLVVTAVLVLWYAFERIFVAPAVPEVTVWSFGVVVASLLINGVRVYLLNRTAAAFKSQTLAANVANFVNDMLASLLVLIALTLIALQAQLGLPLWFVERADAIAAALIALLALRIAWILGLQATRDLMDDVPPDLSRALQDQVSRLPEVVPDSTRVRIRFVGEKPYVDVTVGTPRGRSLEEAHQLANAIEHTVCGELKEASVLVHVEPTRAPAEPYTTAVYSIAQNLGLRVHNLDLYQLADELLVKFDLELPGSLSLEEAHIQSERLEAAVAAELPGNARVMVHLEPRRDQIQPAVRYAPLHERVHRAIQSLAHPGQVAHTQTLLTDKGVVVSLACRFAGTISLTEVHDAMADIERELCMAMPEIVSVQIDPEISNQTEASDSTEDGRSAEQSTTALGSR